MLRCKLLLGMHCIKNDRGVVYTLKIDSGCSACSMHFHTIREITADVIKNLHVLQLLKSRKHPFGNVLYCSFCNPSKLDTDIRKIHRND